MEQGKIDYTISFLTDWHAGSGLSAGAEADAAVIKDSLGFPYIPGKTLKGLFADAFRDFYDLGIEGFDIESAKRLFGYVDDETGDTKSGILFFSNAVLSNNEKAAIGADHSEYLYRTLASTAINSDTGVAKDSSLRVMEVCIPLTLEAYIEGATSSDIQLLNKLAQFIKSLGANRNRGLGRCIIKLS